jgi:hypothetical protein
MRAPLQNFKFPQALLQALTAPTKRLVYGFRRGCEPPLKDRQGKANGPRPFIVGERLSTIEFIAHVFRHFLVESRLRLGKPIWDRVSNALGKQRGAIELEQVFFHHPAHQVRYLHLVDTVAEAALKAIAVE